ncbi:MAG: transcriptional regulator [Caldiserica bacterium]|nr:MAG: transcriptional regulator [Caldisericota bacterium]
MFTIPRIWREKKQRYRLEGSKCKKCSYTSFPPRKVCPKCGSEELEIIKLPETGKILTYTIVRNAPIGFTEFAPYAVGVIELEDGTRMLAQIVDSNFEDIDIGKKVKLVFRKLFSEGEAGVIIYGHKCKLI